MLLFALGRFDDKLGAQGIAQLAAIQYQVVVMAVAPLFAGIVVVIGMTAVVLFGNDLLQLRRVRAAGKLAGRTARCTASAW